MIRHPFFCTLIMLLASIFFNFFSSPLNGLNEHDSTTSVCIENPSDDLASLKNTLSKTSQATAPSFTPDVLISQQTPADIELKTVLKDLCFEADATANPRAKVYNKAKNNYAAQEIILSTDDGFRISTLYFKRPNAQVNIIYVTGYFEKLTPTKEWCAPFAALFPTYNILAFDWRGFGSSTGTAPAVFPLLTKGDFGTHAYPDIQAAIDFIRKDNDKPIVLQGFCAGAAMALHATCQAQLHHRSTADALVINSIFTKFENQFNRAINAEDRWLHRQIFKLPIARRIAEYLMNGSLFDLDPIEMVKKITIPCYFEHFAGDPFAIIQEGREVYQAAKAPIKMFTESAIGRHVRIHTMAPAQYKAAFDAFLMRCGFIK